MKNYKTSKNKGIKPTMTETERYKHLNKYLKEKFGERTLKICVDGGFTCPNRDGTLGTEGCIYCSERGSGELIAPIENITEQVKKYMTTYRAERANKFIVYFQNFTNTYGPVKQLKQKYDSALVDDRIVGLAIGTRPDCISEEIAELLKSYTDKYYVCVELGLQTSDNFIGEKINRGYTSKQFTQAVKILNKYNIDVVAHMMVGLPHETKESIQETVNFINAHKLHGVKIHSTYIVKNTVLEEMFLNNEYTPLDFNEYIEKLIYIITHLKPELIIHRITGDAPREILVAPEWNAHKKKVLNMFNKIMREKNLWQGKYYN